MSSSADAPWKAYPSHWPAARPWTKLAVRTRNPLLRRPSRRERLVCRLALAGLGLLIVVSAVACAAVYQAGVRAERVEAAGRHQISATVLSASDGGAIGSRYLVRPQLPVRYRIAGQLRTGSVEAPVQGAKAGSAIRVWVDRSGAVTTEPRSRAATWSDAVVAVLASIGLLLVVAIAGQAWYDAWTIREHARDWDLAWLRFNAGNRR